MRIYQDLLRYIIENGNDRGDRTGVGTRSVFGHQLRFDLQEGFPLLTTKRVFWRGIIEELLFFLRGDTNTNALAEKKIGIWKGNTTRDFLDNRGLDYPEGEMGPGYGFQWRNWQGTYQTLFDEDGQRRIERKKDGVDQIQRLIDTLKNNPNDRRMLISAWNVGQLDRMALPPCHYTFQCYVNEGKLSLMWQQRSVDVALGLPFNIASYAALVHILAKVTDLEPGELIFTGGDVHIYLNHIEPLQEQLVRDPFPLPKLKIHKDLKNIEDIEQLTFKDFELIGYQYHPPIKMPMAI